MGEPTYSQPNTVSDQEVLGIVLGVVSGMGPITEQDCQPVVQKAIEMLHGARVELDLMELVMQRRLEICGLDESGELQFRKPREGVR